MKIKVGEYVRFEYGKIERVNYQLKEFIDEHISKSENNRVEFLWKIKHSKNIINLVEVGDYVNGYKVDKISINTKTNEKTLLTLELNTLLNILFHSSIGYIKTIVTKEMFKNAEYRMETD